MRQQRVLDLSMIWQGKYTSIIQDDGKLTNDCGPGDAPVATNVLIREEGIVIHGDVAWVTVLVERESVGRAINLRAKLRETFFDVVVALVTFEPTPPIVVTTPVIPDRQAQIMHQVRIVVLKCYSTIIHSHIKRQR